MSPPEPPADGPDLPTPRASWRGGRAAGAARGARRWQREPAPGATAAGRGAKGKSVGLRLAAVFVGTVACLAAYLVLILGRPSQVPVIVLTAPAYQNPLPPNGWTEEDVENLADLDGETITLHDARGACGSRAAVLEVLKECLDDAAKSDPHGPVVVYLNLHGAVDGRGEPCLVPPHASPIDSSTWLPVERIFSLLASHPRTARRDTLVVFDASRLDVEWQLGIARNTFVERLTTLLESETGPRRHMPSLAVLTAAGVDEVSHGSRELGGSAFMHFFRQALAGQADRRDAGGDGDSRVSLRELHAYLARAVPEWSLRNRDARQTPVLSAADGVEFPISWVCRKTLPERVAPPRAIPHAEIADLWSRLERLERFHPVRYAPLLWSELRRSLLYLERAADAGAGYAAAARAAAEDLDARLAAIESRTTGSIGAPWDLFRTDAAPGVRVPARSLALRRAFGHDDGDRYAAWNGVGGELPASRLPGLADEIDLPDDAPIEEAHLLRLLARSPAAGATPDRLAAAVELHRLSEAAASPQDARVWPWVRDSVLRGDEARRRTEDALMAGASEDRAEIEDAEAAYQAALSLGETAAGSWALLDAVRADQVELARWLTDARHRRPANDSPQHTTELIDALLLPMIDEGNKLARDMLASDRGDGTRSESVRTLHRRLQSEYDAAFAASLDDPGRTAAKLREIDLLLSVPLLPSVNRKSLTPAQQRVALLEARAALARDLMTSPSASSAETAEPLRQMAARWQRHPLPALLEGDSPSATAWPQSIVDPSDAERIGELTRGWLAAVSLSTEGTSRPTRVGEGDGAASDLSGFEEEIRNLRLSVDRLRIAASLKEFFPTAMPDPVGRLTRIELAEFLADQGRRKVESFWGPSAPGEPSFFESAADDFDAAQALAGIDSGTGRRAAQARRVLDERTKAAQDGLRVKVSDVLLAAPGRTTEAGVTIRSGSVPLPEGLGAVVAGRPERWDFAPPQAIRLPVSAEGDKVDLLLVSRSAEAADAANRAAVFFRGHVFDTPLLVAAPSGPTTVFVPPATSPTTLTVRSSTRRGLSVVFVLDCSASMSRPSETESSGDAATRLDLARLALGRMLAELAARPRTRVGVVFYGHRVGWRRLRAENSPERFQRSAQHDYARPVPDAVMPFDDVEVVEPLGRLDGGLVGEVEELMTSLRPWGETPLYLAIDTALRQFGEDDEDAERSVVVITDGLNEQTDPSPAARKTPADVLSTWQRRNAAIEIIGFGLSAADTGRAAVEFGRLAEATDGSYEAAGRATDLISALERRLGPAVYRVRTRGGGESRSASIGRSTELDDFGPMPSAFRVSVDAKEEQIIAEGGEGFDLIAAESGPIVSARYVAGSPAFVPLVTPESGEPSGVLLGLHRARRDAEGSVTFEFSLQNADQTFRARPAAVWAEVTPVRRDSSVTDETYVFFHRGFVPGTPVPVLRWSALDWPADAAEARVRFWCGDSPVEPVGALSVGDLYDAATPRSVPGLEGVAFEAYSVDETGGVRIDVIERHAAGSAGVGTIATAWSGPPPVQVVDRFDAKHGIVLHTFRFDGTTASRDLAAASLSVTTRSDLEREALGLETPALIDVSEQADLLVPFRAPEPAGSQPPPAELAAPAAAPPTSATPTPATE